MTPRERFQRFFSGEPVDRPMAWPFVMTIAARHLGVPYEQYARDFDTRARAQVATADDLGVEVITVCSDPTAEAEDCGSEVLYFPDAPPAPDPTNLLLADRSRLASLSVPSVAEGARMQDRLRCIEKLAEYGRGRYPIVGWVEGPISMAAVMRGLNPLMEDIVDEPDWVQDLFEYCLQVAIPFLKAQVEVGADMIGFGDAPASLISRSMYERLVQPFEIRLIEAIHDAGVPARVHICGNTTHLAPALAEIGADMFDFDCLADFAKCVEPLPPGTAVLGNLDPVRDVLVGSPDSIRAGLERCRSIVGERYIAGAGCEIPADTPPENLRAFVMA